MKNNSAVFCRLFSRERSCGRTLKTKLTMKIQNTQTAHAWNRGTFCARTKKLSPIESKRRLIHWLPSVWRRSPVPRHTVTRALIHTRTFLRTNAQTHVRAGNFAAVTNTPETVSHSRDYRRLFICPSRSRPCVFPHRQRISHRVQGVQTRRPKSFKFTWKRFSRVLFYFRPSRTTLWFREPGTSGYLKNTAYDSSTRRRRTVCVHVLIRFCVRLVRPVRSNSIGRNRPVRVVFHRRHGTYTSSELDSKTGPDAFTALVHSWK